MARDFQTEAHAEAKKELGFEVIYFTPAVPAARFIVVDDTGWQRDATREEVNLWKLLVRTIRVAKEAAAERPR